VIIENDIGYDGNAGADEDLGSNNKDEG